ncbi:MAG: hypothetical protein K0S06_3848 [Microvirga sp.]|jgi:hypothetical protein|nr:hypothetical protein [Microvirga sp.]
MTHASHSHARHGGAGQPPAPRHRSCEGIADIDEPMRQLSDLVVFAPFCRRRACRRAGRCRGGSGPPCLFEAPEVFVAPLQNGMREIRRFWSRQRALAREEAQLRPSPGPGGEESNE